MNNKIFLLAFATIFLIGFTSAIDITNCTDLQDMESDLTADYVLLNDIDCSDTINWNVGEGFIPITAFEGTFEGQNFTISELYINLPATTSVGLFAYTSGSIVENVGIINVNITGDTQVGALIGFSEGTLISNSYSTGIVSGGSSVGGLIGDSQTETTISTSYSTSNVVGTYNTGGLVGYNDGNITNSYATGDVNGGEATGGLVGRNDQSSISSITNSFANGSVSGSAGVGGLMGYMYGGLVQNSKYTGNVYGTDYSGGFVADVYGGEINSCFVDAIVNGSGSAGGFASYIEYGLVNNSYSRGKAIVYGLAGTNTGGFISIIAEGGVVENSYTTTALYDEGGGASTFEGFAYCSAGTATNSFWNSETSGEATTSNCGTSKTDAEMKTQSTFTDAGWDLTNIWGQNVITLYPALRYESNVEDYPEISQQSSNLIQGSGTIYETMKSSGAGLGKFFDYMKVALPFLMIGLAIVGIVVVIALSILHALKGNLLSWKK
jgi:hypothetical protein